MWMLRVVELLLVVGRQWSVTVRSILKAAARIRRPLRPHLRLKVGRGIHHAVHLIHLERCELVVRMHLMIHVRERMLMGEMRCGAVRNGRMHRLRRVWQ